MNERLASDSSRPAFSAGSRASDNRGDRDLRGRITYADAGLWDRETESAIGRTLESIRHRSGVPIAIQLAHTGRKASTRPRAKAVISSPLTIRWLANGGACRDNLSGITERLAVVLLEW